MHRITRPLNPLLSQLYFTFGMLATILLAIGALFLMLPVALSDGIPQSDAYATIHFQSMLRLCINVNFYAYQVGMALWGIGGILLAFMLFKFKLVPHFLSLFGYVGYAIFIVGTQLELFGYPVGILLSLPGGLFEIVLSLWLIAKGFRRES